MNVIITGASKGFGKGLVAKFTAAGYRVLACSRNLDALQNMQQEIVQQNTNADIKIKAADLSKKEEVAGFAEWCLSLGTPQILINNAGRFIPGSVNNEPEGALEEMVNTNLYSAYHLTRALLPAMMQAKAGHIFNMCSIASLHAYANGGAYSISKFALLGFSKNLREEMKPHHIKVTSVIPGAAYTDSWAGSGVDPNRIMQANDIVEMIFAASQLSAQACVEEIILRPQLGDL